MPKQLPEIVKNGLFTDVGMTMTKEPPSEEDVEKCKQWIRQWVTKIKTINKRYCSGDLKDFVSNHPDGYLGHIDNGAFIKAAYEEGYDYKRFQPSGYSAYFNMSFVKYEKELKRLENEKKLAWLNRSNNK